MLRWKKVVGYEDRYLVSSEGHVWAVQTKAYLVPYATGHRKYPTVSLSTGDGKWTNRTVHSLMLEAFVGPAPEGHECLHGDDVANNNVLSNLRWGTRSENRREAVMPIGEQHHFTKLLDSEVNEIRASKKSSYVLAPEFGVSAGHIRKIRRLVTRVA